jgi:hypothetical protein
MFDGKSLSPLLGAQSWKMEADTLPTVPRPRPQPPEPGRKEGPAPSPDYGPDNLPQYEPPGGPFHEPPEPFPEPGQPPKR